MKSLGYYFPGLHLQDQVSLSPPFVQIKSCSIHRHTNSNKNLWAKVTSDPGSSVSVCNNLTIISGTRLVKKHNRIETTFFFPLQHFLMSLKGISRQTLIPILLPWWAALRATSEKHTEVLMSAGLWMKSWRHFMV